MHSNGGEEGECVYISMKEGGESGDVDVIGG